MGKMVTCPECGHRVGSAAGLSSHLRRCGMLPDPQEVAAMFAQGMNIVQVRDELQIGQHALDALMEEHGMTTDREAMAARRAEKRRLDLGPQAAESPIQGDCDRCEHERECLDRQGKGLWALCEKPEAHEVAAAESGQLGRRDYWRIDDPQRSSFSRDP